MFQVIKIAVLHLARWLGLFRLARRLTRRRLRILGYHGFASGDEAEFRPGLFIRPKTFARRLAHLARTRTPVLPLGEALARLREDRLPDGAVAITVDDGFYGFYRHALPMLHQHGFPATVYLTSYYCRHPGPVFRLAVQYMFWRATGRPVELGGLGVEGAASGTLEDPAEIHDAMWAVIRHGETECDEAGRRRLAEALARRLDVNFGELCDRRTLDLMTPEEVGELPAAGIDVQLHTHRHRFPDDQPAAVQEIAENRAFLEELLKRPAHDFCYPSGVWSHRWWPWLEAAGVRSAVTCDPGLNDEQTPPLALRRFLDGQDIAQIEFEAEMAGFLELARRARLSILKLFGRGKRG